ncbi:MAG: hypothetical protein HP496_15695 [Nitrospira sp.]|nr:hypothetical protein [Nitrospira sp.]
MFQVGLGTNRPLPLAFILSRGIQIALLTLPAVAPIFKVVPLPIEDWVLTGATGILTFFIMESEGVATALSRKMKPSLSKRSEPCRIRP